MAERTIVPLRRLIDKTMFLGVAIVMLGIGVSIITLTYLLSVSSVPNVLFGIFIVWVGSIALFYAVISEEHTLKEFFLRKSYFLAGLISMVIGIILVFYGAFFNPDVCYSCSELLISQQISTSASVSFGLILLLFGSALIVMSAQKYKHYSQSNALFAFFAGFLMFLGGLISGAQSVAVVGIFVMVLGVAWLGLVGKNPRANWLRNYKGDM